MGFEPTTLGTTIRYSNQLSYIHRFWTAKIALIFLLTKFKLISNAAGQLLYLCDFYGSR